MFSYGGWAYQWANDALGIVLPMRSLGGAIFIFTFSLYPYVYLLVRATLKQQSSHLIQASQALGLTPLQTIRKLIIPIVRPAIVASGMLVMMETLSDYATVKHFGVHTFSVGIFRTWFGLGSVSGAAQMSLLLLMFTISLIVIEKHARRRLRYYNTNDKKSPLKRQKLKGVSAISATLLCAIPLTLGFVLPIIQMVRWIVLVPTTHTYHYYLELIGNTVILGVGTSIIVIILALLINYGERAQHREHTYWLNRIATTGYAIPSVIIAIGALLVGAGIEKTSATLFGTSTGIFISGTLFILYFAYTVRFMTLGFNAIENSLIRISPNIDYVATTLNVHGVKRLCKLHIPLIRPGITVAAILVFVDVVKEVPATLILRPFDFNTLAIHTYELASSENLGLIGWPALFIVLTGSLSMYILWSRIKLTSLSET